MLDGIEGIMSLAAASGADLATASDIVTDALTAFGKSAEDAGRLADIMAAASSSANTNVEMMGETFKYAAPVAGALGISMEDTAIAVGLMANNGIKASQAGTSLRTGLTNLANPTSNMLKAMDEYNIKLAENNDGSINLRDTMVLLRDRFSGMTESEQAAAAASIFGKNAMAGWLAIINSSDDDFNNLADAIDNSNGTAAEMADVMQDNFAGSLTVFKSALEGLGITIYEQVAEPLKDAVDFATGIISSITKAVGGKGGARDYLDDFYKSVKSANDEVSRALENAQATVDNAKSKVGLLTGYETEFTNILTQCENFKTSLDGLGGKSEQIGYLKKSFDDTTSAIRGTYVITDEFTKSKINTMVQDLSGDVDGLAEAWNSETGELTASREELEKWFGVAKEVAMYEALEDSIKELTTAYGQAAVAQVQAQSGYDASKKALDDFYESLGMTEEQIISYGGTLDEARQRTDPIYSQYLELSGAVKGWSNDIEIANTNLDIAKTNLTESQQIMKDVAGELENLGYFTEEEAEAAKESATAVEEETKAVKDSATSTNEMVNEKIALKKATDDTTEATEENTKKTKEEKQTYDDSAVSVSAMNDEKMALKKTTKEVTEATEEEDEALKEAIEAVHAYSDAQKELREAVQGARDEMKGTFEDIKSAVDGAVSLDPFSKWTQDVESGWEAFDAAMLSQIEGMKNYRENMALIRDYLGETAPDFVGYLEEMGDGGAQFVDDLARGLREGGEASKASIDYTVSLWRDGLDMEDEIEDDMARNRIALELGLAGLTDSDVLSWEDLGYAFDEGIGVIHVKGGEMTQEVSDSFWTAVDIAKSVGMEVPSGLAESIRSSDDPEAATREAADTINACLRARGEEMLAGAKDFGLLIPQGVTEVLTNPESTGDQIQWAVTTLADSIKTSAAPKMQAAGTEVGEAAGDATVAGIQNTSGDVVNAATTAVSDAQTAASNTADSFKDTGSDAMDSMQSGVSNEASVVSDEVVNAVVGAATSGETKADTRMFALGRYLAAKMLLGLQSRYNDLYDAGADAVLQIVNGANFKAGDAVNAFDAILNDVNRNATYKMNDLYGTIVSTMGNIGTAISQTQLSFPYIKTPHIRWEWKLLEYGDGGSTYYPEFKVDWYAKAMQNGMILNNPTIFGAMNGRFLGGGEAGSEAVVGTDSLMRMIRDAVDSSQSPILDVMKGTVESSHTIASTLQDISAESKSLVDVTLAVADKQQSTMSDMMAKMDDSQGSQSSMLDAMLDTVQGSQDTVSSLQDIVRNSQSLIDATLADSESQQSGMTGLVEEIEALQEQEDLTFDIARDQQDTMTGLVEEIEALQEQEDLNSRDQQDSMSGLVEEIEELQECEDLTRDVARDQHSALSDMIDSMDVSRNTMRDIMGDAAGRTQAISEMIEGINNSHSMITNMMSEAIGRTQALMTEMLKEMAGGSQAGMTIGEINIPIRTMENVDARRLAMEIEPEITRILMRRASAF